MPVINGTPGDDDIVAPAQGDNEIYAGAGADTIFITRNPDNTGTLFVDAGEGNDRIRVDAFTYAPTIVHGGAGNDTFYMINGGTLYGDAGADVFRMNGDSNALARFTIADFSAEDRLDLMPYFENDRRLVGGDPFASGLVRFIPAGPDTFLQIKMLSGEWWTFGVIANQDASKITAAQLGGFSPVTGQAPTWLSMSVAATSAMEGSGVLTDIYLSAPMSTPVTVAIRTSGNGDGNNGVHSYVTFQPGQTHIQARVTVTDDIFTGPRGPFTISVSSNEVGSDPRLTNWFDTLTVIDNDQNGFQVQYAEPWVTYRTLTLLSDIRPADLPNLPRTVPSTLTAALPARDMARLMEPFVLGTTSVALTAYQFFTGKSPGEPGLKYLVNSPDNPDDLNDAAGMYAAMNTENRYINFAANLGLVGEGKAAFAASYKDLAFRQAVEKAYDAIIGKAYAAAAGINVTAAIDGVVAARTYFDAVATERMGGFDHDLAMKAGMIGYLIAEGQKAHVGVYARAVENFYIDYMDGKAHHNVDLVAVYGPGTFLDAI